MINYLFTYIMDFVRIYFNLCLTFSSNSLSISDFSINFLTLFSKVDFYVFYVLSNSNTLFLYPITDPSFLFVLEWRSTEFFERLSYYITDFDEIVLGGVFFT